MASPVDKVFLLFMRRMRAPLIILLAAYSLSVLGLVLIPGVDDAGRPWRMDFFHALYVVSYTGSTIGFGEIPYAFTTPQRMWVMVCIYLTVIAWLYAIGKILALMQDAAFKAAVIEYGFARGVRRIREPFYLVCGYGDTGSLLVRALADRHINTVVLDCDQERITDLTLADLPLPVPGLTADASVPLVLQEAGLTSAYCAGVLALTNDDNANLKVAITAKLLNPRLLVICRAESRDTAANMASFGTDHIVNPFDTFAERFALALHSPGTHLLHEWLTGVPNTPLASPEYPPQGIWVLCGYGRLGKALRERMESEGLRTVIIEANPDRTGWPERCVKGRGTEAETLLSAGIKEAAGLVAGTDDDTNNLSIAMTARQLKPDLFIVARQNRRDNEELFLASSSQRVMQRSEIIARKILALITAPHLTNFLKHIRYESNEWANQLVSRLSAVIGEVVPEVWAVTLNSREAPAVAAAIGRGDHVTLDLLMRDPADRSQRLSCLPLMLVRDRMERLVPEREASLFIGDAVLFCGVQGVPERMRTLLVSPNALTYVRTGESRPEGWVWEWLSRR